MMASSRTTRVRWLGDTPPATSGVTFAVPWRAGACNAKNTVFSCTSEGGRSIPVQTWPIGYWPDGTIKWTSHAIPQTIGVESAYDIKAEDDSYTAIHPAGIDVGETSESIKISTGRITAVFPQSGTTIIKDIINARGDSVGTDGHLVLLSQTGISDLETPDPSILYHQFNCAIEEVKLEQAGPIRAVIAVSGVHSEVSRSTSAKMFSHPDWIPFKLRFYLYSGSEAIRVVRTITYDGNNNDFIRGIGIRLNAPLAGVVPFDRHVRFAGASGGTLGESAQGITGLWKDPGKNVRLAQVQGKTLPPPDSWNSELPQASLRWVPVWNDYSLHQLSSDGFTLEKRLKEGHPWIKTASGTKAGGLVYVGGASRGGLAVGSRHFWERYPTGIDVRGLGSCQDTSELTLWFYDPKAGPMDLRPYHDGLGQEGFDDQLDALKITYEDWEPELGSPFGVSRTNELFLFATESTPEANGFADLAKYVRNPPKLFADPGAIHTSGAFGKYWSPRSQPASKSLVDVDKRLDFLFEFYQEQVKQRRWYGFWDHGDIMHTYDADRHTWRYDVGGYAWDNSELSPDLWLWLFFLRTGRPDVFNMAEALTRHTGEVDVYHSGPYKGLGTRHGVQHWSDSCKQARISNALYRRFFYFLSGGDERVGELLEETLETDQNFLTLDPYRKVRKDRETYKPDPHGVEISLGTDWAALASSWLIEYERLGPRWIEAKQKLFVSIEGIGRLTNGFVTGNVTYDPATGHITPPLVDPENKGVVKVSHLSAMFGLFEVAAEIFQLFPEQARASGFRTAWLDYCAFFSASAAEQENRFGQSGWGQLQLRQGHSRLTAFAARELSRPDLVKRALEEFENGDAFRDFGPNVPWTSTRIDKSYVLEPTDEAPWVSTNIAALYGLSGIQNLALITDE
ncbi:secreted protein [Colletotrichum kahawae]|uniref:Secreted protein n=1 Tax=Colletotrichum kahawae TaxID=34407 RepID=A0AAD9Y428_COLKA|nr:secreted protein [Colletotrichum kahawae]